MGDLQCPATIVLVARESIASRGAPAIFEAGHLSGVFVASLVADDPAGLSAVAAAAGAWSRRLSVMPDVADGPALARAILDLADLHRGETIAVVATAAMIRTMLGASHPALDPVAIAVDAAGWRLGPGTDGGRGAAR